MEKAIDVLTGWAITVYDKIGLITIDGRPRTQGEGYSNYNHGPYIILPLEEIGRAAALLADLARCKSTVDGTLRAAP